MKNVVATVNKKDFDSCRYTVIGTAIEMALDKMFGSRYIYVDVTEDGDKINFTLTNNTQGD